MTETKNILELLGGYAAIFVAMVAHALSSAAVQSLGGAVHDFQLSAARGLLQGPLYFALGSLFGMDLSIKREHILPLLYLAVLYVIYNVGYYGSNVYLPMAEATAIDIILSMVAAQIQSKLWFKREIHVVYVISLIVCTIGILMIAQPHFLFPMDPKLHKNTSKLYLTTNVSLNGSNDTSIVPENLQAHGRFVSSSGQALGYTMAVIGGSACGMTYDVNAILLNNLKPFIKLAYFTSVYLIMSIILSIYSEPVVLVMSLDQFLLVLAHSLGAAIGCFCTIYGAHVIGGIKASLIFSLEIIFNLFVQYTFMSSILPGNQNWVAIVGAIVTFAGVGISPLLNIIQNIKQSNTLE